MKKLGPTEIFMAFCVEVVRQLWNRGLYRQNKWLQMCHDYWFDTWTIWRTGLTMEDVDRQIEKLNPDPVEITKPVYWEEDGDSALGGAMGITHEAFDRPHLDSGSMPDPVQGPE